MKLRSLISVSLAVGILMMTVFGLLLTTIVRSARDTHQTIIRLQSVDEAMQGVMNLYRGLSDLTQDAEAVILLNRPVQNSALDQHIADVRKWMDELDHLALHNAILGSAAMRYPPEMPASLVQLEALSASLHATTDPRQIGTMLTGAARSDILQLSSLTNAELEIAMEIREQGRLATRERLRMWEVSAFWWLLIGANLILLGMIAAGGLIFAMQSMRRRSVREISSASSIAAAADLSRSRFLAAASHDLRQPLQAVMLFTAALRRRVADPYVTSLIEGVSAAVTSLDRMFNGLLDISKLDAGIVSAERADFAVSRLLRNIEGDFKAHAGAKGLRLTMISNRTSVHTDPVLLESMIRNLVSNAIKYTRQGQIIVTCRNDGRTVVIDVCDTGAGISDEEQVRIFEEFHRVASMATTEEGLGLGLAIVRRLSILLGVDVSLRSIIGIGSTFTLRVPCATVEQASDEPIDTAHAFDKIQPMHVLLLDDDILLRRAMVVELVALGMNVTDFGRAEDVFTRLATGNQNAAFDVALMDFNLGGGLNGVEVLDRLAVEFGLAVPALIMTGETDPVILEELGESGYAWLQKPVSAEVVVGALARILHASDSGDPNDPDDLLSALQRSTSETTASRRISTNTGRAMVIS